MELANQARALRQTLKVKVDPERVRKRNAFRPCIRIPWREEREIEGEEIEERRREREWEENCTRYKKRKKSSLKGRRESVTEREREGGRERERERKRP